MVAFDEGEKDGIRIVPIRNWLLATRGTEMRSIALFTLCVLVLIMVSGCLMFYTGSEEGPFKVVVVRNEPGRPQEAILQSECRANWEVVFGPDGGGQKRRV